MGILRRKFDYLQKVINSDMNKILDKKCMGSNEFHTNFILSAIEESNNMILSVMENMTTSNGNEDLLLKDEECKYL